MPKKSGLEVLSVVRRRLSGIPAIIISGAYEPGKELPGRVIAGAFYAKGIHPADHPLAAVAELLDTDLSTNRHPL